MTQCGLVYPFWVQLGWVQWANTSERQKMYNIEYRRCDGKVEAVTEKDGLNFPWCPQHVEEMKGKKP